MGDRGNIIIRYGEGKEAKDIYLYTHWGGSDLPDLLQTVIKKRWRWDDPSYLARLIFQEMTRDCEDQETGFGIDVEAPDNEHDYLVVCTETQSIELRKYDFDQDNRTPGRLLRRWTYEQFCKADLTEKAEVES